MPTVTLGDTVNRVYARLEWNDVFYPYDEVVDAINEGIAVLNLFTGYLQASGTVTSVANQVWYSTPSNVLLPTRVAIAGQYLRKVPFRNIGRDFPMWQTETTNTVGRPFDSWIPLGLKTFAVYPIDPDGGKTIKVTGVAELQRLTSDVDLIPFPSEFAGSLEDYAAHVCMMKCGGNTAKAAMGLYQGFLGRMKELKRYKSQINPRFYVEEVKSAQ